MSETYVVELGDSGLTVRVAAKNKTSAAAIVRKFVSVRVADRGTPTTYLAGMEKPFSTGESAYWTTPSGKTIVRHPSSYGWRCVYHCSTRENFAGAKWIEKQLKCPRGYAWGKDSLGICLIQIRTRETYHPHEGELWRGAKHVAERLRSAIKIRKEGLADRKSLRKMSRGLLVFYQDSIRGGNCGLGTSRFAAQNGHSVNDYSAMSAERLLDIADRIPDRAREIERAVRAAIERQTLVCI
jgi:hypothetical protein